MGLLYPGALVFLAIVPALVLAYLARERPARVVVSSVLAFRALRGLRKERFGGRPRFDWMFLVELILLGPEDQWGNLLAEAIRHVGQVFLEKSGAVESETTH